MIHVRVEAAKSIKNAAARINKKNCPLGEVPKGLFLDSFDRAERRTEGC